MTYRLVQVLAATKDFDVMKKALAAILGILILGFIGITLVQGQKPTSLVTQQELLQRIKAKRDMLVLDVRTPREFESGRVPGAVNIPHTELAQRMSEVLAHCDKDVVVYCEAGVRAGVAEELLQAAGFEAIQHLKGDMSAWRKSALPVETGKR